MIKIPLTGSPQEIGEAIGEINKNEMANYVKERKELMQYELAKINSTFDNQKFCLWVKKIEKFMISYAKDEYLELNGISRSSNVAFGDLLFTAGYTDFFDLFAKKNKTHDTMRECSCLCCRIKYNNQPTTVLAQNWDLDLPSAKRIKLFEKNYADGTKIYTISTIVGLTHLGMNQSGMFVGTANLACTKTCTGNIFPVVIQQILKSRNVKDVKKILLTPRLSGHYFYFGYSNEEMYGVETTSKAFDLQPLLNSSFVTHTNHYKNDKLIKSGINYSTSSQERDKFLFKSLNDKDLTIQSVQRLLSNHSNNICRHFDKDDPLSVATALSVIAIPKYKKMIISEGNPCKDIWQTYEIK